MRPSIAAPGHLFPCVRRSENLDKYDTSPCSKSASLLRDLLDGAPFAMGLPTIIAILRNAARPFSSADVSIVFHLNHGWLYAQSCAQLLSLRTAAANLHVRFSLVESAARPYIQQHMEVCLLVPWWSLIIHRDIA